MLSVVSEDDQFKSIPKIFTVGKRLHRPITQEGLPFCGFDMSDDELIEDDSVFFVFNNVHGEVFHIFVR